MYCVNDTETCETYTAGTTLSLHDALPIALGPRLLDRGEHALAPVAVLLDAVQRGQLLGGQRVELADDRGDGLLGQVGHRVSLRLRAGFLRVEVGVIGHGGFLRVEVVERSEEHTSELQSLMRISYAVFCLKKKNIKDRDDT